MMMPAHRVIEICGGVDAVTEMVGRHRSRVYRWGYAREAGGTGGLIPAEAQVKLLDAARARGIDLRPEHFFLEPGAAQEVAE